MQKKKADKNILRIYFEKKKKKFQDSIYFTLL